MVLLKNNQTKCLIWHKLSTKQSCIYLDKTIPKAQFKSLWEKFKLKRSTVLSWINSCLDSKILASGCWVKSTLSCLSNTDKIFWSCLETTYQNYLIKIKAEYVLIAGLIQRTLIAGLAISWKSIMKEANNNVILSKLSINKLELPVVREKESPWQCEHMK